LIDPTNQLGSCDTIKCIGPGLYDFTDDGTLAQWLADYPHSDDELTVRFIEAIKFSTEGERTEVGSTKDPLHLHFEDQKLYLEDTTQPFIEILEEELLGDEVQGLAILAVEIPALEAFHLEIDETQVGDLDACLEEAIIANDLPPPLHFRRTSEGIQVGHDLPIYPPVPNDWYHGPTDPVHVPPADWKEVNIAPPGEEPKIIKMGSQLTDEETVAYAKLFWEFREVLAWSYLDLKGIPPDITEHRIHLLPDVKPVRQKERQMNPQMQLVVKAKLTRLLQAGFIEPVEITDWVSPMVLVKKKNGKIRVCIDFRALNKQTQKDHFPLPFISTILEEVAGHELYTLMDGYSGYNQINVAS
jgi:hypothetical protein